MTDASYLLPVAVCVAGFLAWTLRLRRAFRVTAPPLTGSADQTRVSIIVPARNEAHNLPALLASLRGLTPPAHQIIIVDDHSTDGTGDLARAAGAIVVTPPPLPAGWLGKPWACHAGAQAATGDLLLFSDADTVHAPWSLTRAIARLQATPWSPSGRSCRASSSSSCWWPAAPAARPAAASAASASASTSSSAATPTSASAATRR
jgi:cellulose synthase/poly-beta-1,6-N-acetylglucosamine synthase-like glycosyltransferase